MATGNAYLRKLQEQRGLKFSSGSNPDESGVATTGNKALDDIYKRRGITPAPKTAEPSTEAPKFEGEVSPSPSVASSPTGSREFKAAQLEALTPDTPKSSPTGSPAFKMGQLETITPEPTVTPNPILRQRGANVAPPAIGTSGGSQLGKATFKPPTPVEIPDATIGPAKTEPKVNAAGLTENEPIGKWQNITPQGAVAESLKQDQEKSLESALKVEFNRYKRLNNLKANPMWYAAAILEGRVLPTEVGDEAMPFKELNDIASNPASIYKDFKPIAELGMQDPEAGKRALLDYMQNRETTGYDVMRSIKSAGTDLLTFGAQEMDVPPQTPAGQTAYFTTQVVGQIPQVMAADAVIPAKITNPVARGAIIGAELAGARELAGSLARPEEASLKKSLLNIATNAAEYAAYMGVYSKLTPRVDALVAKSPALEKALSTIPGEAIKGGAVGAVAGAGVGTGKAVLEALAGEGLDLRAMVKKIGEESGQEMKEEVVEAIALGAAQGIAKRFGLNVNVPKATPATATQQEQSETMKPSTLQQGLDLAREITSQGTVEPAQAPTEQGDTTTPPPVPEATVGLQNAPQPLNRTEYLRDSQPGMDDNAIRDMVTTTQNLSDEEFKAFAQRVGKPEEAAAPSDMTPDTNPKAPTAATQEEATPPFVTWFQGWQMNKRREGIPESLSPLVKDSAAELPPVKDGYVRLYHGTPKGALAGIFRDGIKSGKALGQEASAFGSNDFAMASTDPDEGYGEVNIVIDVPADAKGIAGLDTKKSGRQWAEFRRVITPDEIVAVIPHKLSLDSNGLVEAMNEYQASFSSRQTPQTTPEKATTATAPNWEKKLGGKQVWQVPQETFVKAVAKDDQTPTMGILRRTGNPGYNVEREAAVTLPEQPESDAPTVNGETRMAIVYRNASGQAKGSLRFTVDAQNNVVSEPQVFVDPAFRRQSIATNLYDTAKNAGYDLSEVSGTTLTTEGAKLYHARAVREAIARGENVPAEVRATYERQTTEEPFKPNDRVFWTNAKTGQRREGTVKSINAKTGFAYIVPADVKSAPGVPVETIPVKVGDLGKVAAQTETTKPTETPPIQEKRPQAGEKATTTMAANQSAVTPSDGSEVVTSPKAPWTMTQSEFTTADIAPVAPLRKSYNVDMLRTRNNLNGYAKRVYEKAPKGTWKDFLEDIQKNGIRTPIELTVRKDGKVDVVEGTHRLLAAEELGMETVPADIRGDKKVLHRMAVDLALSEGKPIPPEVLKDYPDLQEKYGKKEQTTTPPKVEENTSSVSGTEQGATQGERPSSMSEENPAFMGARPTLPTNTPPLAPVSRRAIVKYLDNAFGPIRVGMKGKILGLFKRREGVIRTKGAEDFPVATHEVGHRLDRDMQLADPAFDAELLPLGTPTAPQNSTQQYVRGEGVGEFIRLYITDPNQAQQQAPNFYAHFLTRMNAEPEVKAKIDGARELVKRWTSQNPHDKLNGVISVDDEGAKRPNSWERIKAQIIEQLAPLERATKQLAQGRNLTVDENPFELALLARGWAGRAEALLEYGIVDKDFNKVGESFKDILEDVNDKDAFRRYTVARRAREIMDKRKLPIEQVLGVGVTESEVDQVITDLRGEYEPLHRRMVKFQDAILQELVDSGRLSAKEATLMRQMNEEYIPFHRFFDEKTGAFNFAGANHLVNVGNPIKSFKGSDRTIVDPLESVIKNTYAIVNASARNRVGRALLDLAEKSQNMGAVVEIVDEDAKDANIVNVYRDGEKVRIKVDEELHRALLFLDREQTAMWVKIVGLPARTLRAGAILNPDFLASNPLADQITAFINSEFGYVPFVDLFRGLRESAPKTDLFWKFMAAGGAQSQMVSLDRNSLQKELNKYVETKLSLGSVLKRANPLEVLRALSEQGELGTRLGEFRKGVTQDNSREGIQRAALESRDVTIDFARTGSKTKTVNQISAFFNASVQGLDKTAREFKAHPIRTAAKAVAAYTVPTFILYLLNRDNPYYEEKPEWAKDAFWFIPLDWSGGVGTAKQSKHFLWIPRKHALAMAFGALPERLMRMADKHDPRAFDKEFASRFGQSLLPSAPLPTAIMPLLENAANYSFYTDLPIVPRREERMEPRDRFGPYTSDAAKVIGGVTNTSPRKTDNLIRGWTGGLGTLATQLVGSGLRLADRNVDVPYVDSNATTADRGVAAYPIARRFLRDLGEIGIGSSYDEFTDKLTMAEQKYSSTTDDDAKKQLLKALKPMRKVNDELSDLNSRRREILVDNSLSPEEKRRMIDEIDMELTNAARKALGKPEIRN